MDRFVFSGWAGVAAALLAAAGLAGSAHAQSGGSGGGDERSATQQRLERLREQIKSSEARLSEATAAERASEKKLQQLDRRIAERSELADLYKKRLTEIRRAQDSLRRSLQTRQKRLAELKKEYKRRATHAYKYGRLRDLALVLAARSVNEMLVRVQYLRRFAQQREDKLDAVQASSRQIKAQRQALAQKRDSTAALLRRADAQKENLSRLRQSRRTMIQELRRQQASLEEDISEQQEQANQLQARLERLAARGARRSRRAAEEASPERRAAFERLTGSFEQNKGSLPWPAEGVVTEEYGLQTDPVHGTKTPNPGVMLGTEPQAQVQAVFEGQVTRIDKVPDLGTVVFVRHGQYLSLYGNLSLVYAGEGDEIKAGAPVGRAGTDSAPRGAGVFFGLFRGGRSFDPADWLRSR
ncbi:MAG: peptidase M23 [Bacteroidetes bacterium QS_9_68_14]|nr:MAG: peptidase M23 [Bacteroidetes bacterium QS_9_68_14]